MKTAIRILLLTAFMYLLGAFVAGDFNSGNWEVKAKVLYGFIYMIICVSVILYNVMVEDE